MKKNDNGFTLIELMIVVVIVGVLAAVALPSYRESVRKSARADAKSALMNMAQMQERFFTNNGTYRAMSSAAGADPDNWQNYVGNSVGSRTHDITVAAGPSGSITTSFTITATPANGFTDPTCGTYTFSSDDAKGSTVGNAKPCW